MSGQIAGMVKDIPTCKDLMARLMAETKRNSQKKQFSWGGINRWENSIQSFQDRAHRKPGWEKIFMRNMILQKGF